MTKRIENKGTLKRVFGVLVVLLLASALLVGAGSAASWTDTNNFNSSWYDSYSGNVYEIYDARDLAAFSEKVSVNSSSKETFAGKTVKLMGEIDLSDYLWTPIGSETNPFSGVFDGNGYNICNMNVQGSASYQGLFGFVNNTSAGVIYADVYAIYDVVNEQRIATNVANDYGVQIGNFNLVNPTVTSSADKVGAVVGCAKYAYIHDINVGTEANPNGKVIGSDSVGGVIGRGYGTVIEDCNNYITVTNGNIASSTYNAGGIAGSMRSSHTQYEPVSCSAIFDSNNYGTITYTLTDGGVAGICGHAENMLVIDGCENHGAISCKVDSAATVPSAKVIAGILGMDSSSADNVIAASKNYASITNTGNEPMGAIGGIYGRTTGKEYIFDCENHGDLNGAALYMGGVAAHVSVSDYDPVLWIKDTQVSGSVNNPHPTGLTSTYVASSSSPGARIENAQFADTAAFEKALVQEGTLYLKDVTVSNPSGIVTLSATKQRTIVEETGCSLSKSYTITVDNTMPTGWALSLTIPESVITINGDTTASSELQFNGDNLEISNNANGNSFKLKIKDSQKSSITNNGNIKGLSISTSDNIVITNNAEKTINDGVEFSGSKDATIYNYGTITRTASGQGAYHVLYFYANSDNAVIHNFGTINQFTSGTVNQYIVHAYVNRFSLLNYETGVLKSNSGSYFAFETATPGIIFSFKDGVKDGSNQPHEVTTNAYCHFYNASNITELVIVTSPTKTEYKAGDIFNPSGMQVNASYVKEDGTTEEIELDLRWLVYPTVPLTAGQTIEVTFLGIGTTIPVTVNAPATPSSSGSSSGSSVWLTETQTPTPTPTPTETVTPTDAVPTDIPVTQPTEEPSSPGFGVLAVLAGLGAVAVLRRK